MVKKLFGNFAKLIFLRVEMLERLILIPYPE